MDNIVWGKNVIIQLVKVAIYHHQESTFQLNTVQQMTHWLAFKIMENTATTQINTGAKSSMDLKFKTIVWHLTKFLAIFQKTLGIYKYMIIILIIITPIKPKITVH